MPVLRKIPVFYFINYIICSKIMIMSTEFLHNCGKIRINILNTAGKLGLAIEISK